MVKAILRSRRAARRERGLGGREPNVVVKHLRTAESASGGRRYPSGLIQVDGPGRTQLLRKLEGTNSTPSHRAAAAAGSASPAANRQVRPATMDRRLVRRVEVPASGSSVVVAHERARQANQGALQAARTVALAAAALAGPGMATDPSGDGPAVGAARGLVRLARLAAVGRDDAPSAGLVDERGRRHRRSGGLARVDWQRAAAASSRGIPARHERASAQLRPHGGSPAPLLVPGPVRWDPIIVLIDNLDRCRADYVVEMLEGIQTLLRNPRVSKRWSLRRGPGAQQCPFIAFVVAADRGWLCDSYLHVYEEFEATTREPGRPFGSSFSTRSSMWPFASRPFLPRLAQACPDAAMGTLIPTRSSTAQTSSRSARRFERLSARGRLKATVAARFPHQSLCCDAQAVMRLAEIELDPPLRAGAPSAAIPPGTSTSFSQSWTRSRRAAPARHCLLRPAVDAAARGSCGGRRRGRDLPPCPLDDPRPEVAAPGQPPASAPAGSRTPRERNHAARASRPTSNRCSPIPWLAGSRTASRGVQLAAEDIVKFTAPLRPCSPSHGDLHDRRTPAAA